MRTLCILALFAGTAGAADQPPSVETLIEQLGSASFPARERAMKQLRERGPAALPALRKALASKDEEVRKRAESLIPPLEIEEALLPKHVTVKGNGRPIEEVLKDLEKQTGYQVRGGGFPQGAIDISRTASVKTEVNDLPFWEAMERVAKDTGCGIELSSYQSKPMVHLRAATSQSPIVNIRGPFRLEATWFHEDRDVDFTRVGKGTDGRRDHRLTLSVSVLAEPRLTFLKVHAAKVEEALDSDGKSILEPTGAPKVDNPPPGRGTFRGESTAYSDVRLRRAGESAKTAKVIRGTIPVRTILIRRPVVVTNKLMESTGTSFRAGTDSLQITRVQNQGGNNVEVQLLIPRDRNADWSETEKWYERFHVEDDAGHRFQDHGRGSSSNGTQYWISIYCGPPNGKAVGPPTKLVFEDWVVHEHEIPFEFRDVPLP